MLLLIHSPSLYTALSSSKSVYGLLRSSLYGVHHTSEVCIWLFRNLDILKQLNINLSESKLETISLLLKKYENNKNNEENENEENIE